MNSPCIKPDWPAPANVVAFTTLRGGGHSAAPYASLNLADHVADDPAAVRANRTALRDLLPPAASVHWLTQVHGAEVVQAADTAAIPRADAHWSRGVGQACAVLTADCLPVLLCSLGGEVVAAAHAGWRGLLDGVLENTVAAMGVAPDQLPDVHALVGDRSDGLPGVPGWGVRSTAVVLARYGTIEAIPDDASQWDVDVRGAARLATALAERRQEAVWCRDLARLRTDLPLRVSADDLEWRGAERPAMEALCATLGDDAALARVTRWAGT